jgi:molecular chaperone GrpE
MMQDNDPNVNKDLSPDDADEESKSEAVAEAQPTPEPRNQWTQENIFGPSSNYTAGDTLEEQLEFERQRCVRLKADFENYKKRIRKERELVLLYANELLLRDFLPLFDDLRRAAGHCVEGDSPQDLVGGIEMILNRFTGMLINAGAQPFESKGTSFDPTRHDAVAALPAPDKEPGTVIEEIEQGFSYFGKLLRPAKVVVNKIQATRPKVVAPKDEPAIAQPPKDEPAVEGSSLAALSLPFEDSLEPPLEARPEPMIESEATMISLETPDEELSDLPDPEETRVDLSSMMSDDLDLQAEFDAFEEEDTR